MGNIREHQKNVTVWEGSARHGFDSPFELRSPRLERMAASLCSMSRPQELFIFSPGDGLDPMAVLIETMKTNHMGFFWVTPCLCEFFLLSLF